MFEHLDDPEGVAPGPRELTRVLRRADAIRGRRRITAAVLTCTALLAASIGFYLARPSATPRSSTLSAYQFNRIKGPLPIGSPVPTTALVDVQFANSQVGFALALHGGDVLLAATTDGGATWSVRNDHMPPGLGTDTGYPGQFEFVGFTGYLWGARSGSGMPLWVTKNDGLTWQQASPMSAYVYDVSAIGLNAWALAGTCPVSVSKSPVPPCVVEMEETLDGGTTWTTLGPIDAVAGDATPPQPVELARITKLRAYVLTYTVTGQRGFPAWQLFFTDDGGAAWTQRTAPCAGPLSLGAEVAASSTEDLWLLCGGEGSTGAQSKQIFRSGDGGVSWTLVASALGVGTATPAPDSVPPDSLPIAGYVAPYTVGHRNLAVLSPTTAWLYPARAGLFETTDGGASWAPVSSLVAAGFADGGSGNITFLSGTEGWICEYGVGLWHTADGTHWYPLGPS